MTAAFLKKNQGKVYICDYILYSLYSNAKTRTVRKFGEQYENKFCAVDIFLVCHPSSCNFTRPSRVRPCFHDLAGNVLNQSE